MTDGRGVLRDIAWRELFPWLLLFRTFRLAIHPGILMVALIAALLTPLGWQLGRWVFRVPDPASLPVAAPAQVTVVDVEQKVVQTVTPPLTAREAAEKLLAADGAELSRLPGAGRTHDPDVLSRLRRPAAAFSTDSPIVYVFDRFTAPILRTYRTETPLHGFAFYLLGTLWTLAVWAFGGGMITRMAAVELGREEQASVTRAFWLTLRRWFDFFSAPLYPVLGTLLIALLSSLVGMLLWSSDVGVIVAGVLWIFVLIGGALAALLLLWLFIGWPLMWPAISAEETGDSFEAMSRSFAYAFQRPLHYLFYAAVAALFGFICWSVVDFLCQLTLNASYWAVSWGSGHERIDEIQRAVLDSEQRTLSFRVGAGMIRGINSILLALSEAFAYSFFWVSATAIYLLLRQDVDRTEFDEVWIDDEVARYPLPPLDREPATVPAPSLPATEPAPQDAAAEKAAAMENNQAE